MTEINKQEDIPASEIIEATPYLRADVTGRPGTYEPQPRLNWKQEIEVNKNIEANKSSGSELWEASKENEQIVPALARLSVREEAAEVGETPIDFDDEMMLDLMKDYDKGERKELSKSSTQEEFQMRKQFIDEDRKRNQIVNEHGYTGVAAALGASMLDIPVALVGVALGTVTGGSTTVAAGGQKVYRFGKILNKLKGLGGKGTLGTAIRSGTVTAAEAASIEAVLMKADSQRDLNDFMLNVGGAFVFGSAIGVGGRKLGEAKSKRKKAVADDLGDVSAEVKKAASKNQRDGIYGKMDDVDAPTYKVKAEDPTVPNTKANVEPKPTPIHSTNTGRKEAGAADPVIKAKLDEGTARAGTDIVEVGLHTKAQKGVSKVTHDDAVIRVTAASADVKKAEKVAGKVSDEGEAILNEIKERAGKAYQEKQELKKRQKSEPENKDIPEQIKQKDAEIKALKEESVSIKKQQSNKGTSSGEDIGHAKFTEDIEKGKLRDQKEAIQAKKDYKEWTAKTQEQKNKEVFGEEKPVFKENEPPVESKPRSEEAPEKGSLGEEGSTPKERKAENGDPRDYELVDAWKTIREFTSSYQKHWIATNKESVIATWARNIASNSDLIDSLGKHLITGDVKKLRKGFRDYLNNPDGTLDPSVSSTLRELDAVDSKIIDDVIEDVYGTRPAKTEPEPKLMSEQGLDDALKNLKAEETVKPKAEKPEVKPEPKPVDRFKDTHKEAGDVEDFLLQNPTGPEVIAWFQRAFKGEDFALIAKHIGEFMHPDLRIRVAVPSNLGALADELGSWIGGVRNRALGLHSNDHNAVIVRGKGIGPDWKLNMPKTLLHEMLHNATVNGYNIGMKEYNIWRRAIKSGMSDAELGPQGKAFKDIWDLQQLMLKQARSEHGVNLPHFLRAGLANPKELITWGMTDPTMKKWLQDTKLVDVGGKKLSAWSKFTKAMRKVIGMKSRASSVYDELLNRTDGLLQVNPRKADTPVTAPDSRIELDAEADDGVFTYNDDAGKLLSELAEKAPDEVNTAILRSKDTANAISNAVQSIFTSVDLSGNKYLRGLGHILFENPQGNKLATDTADVWSGNYGNRIRSAVANRINTGFSAYAAHKGVGRIKTMFDAGDLKASFDAEVRGAIKSQELENLSPGVREAAEGYMDAYELALKIRKESGEVGMQNIAPDRKYIPNIYDGSSMQKMAAELGRDSVIQLLAKGFRTGGNELSDKASYVLAKMTYENNVGRTINTGNFNPDMVLSTTNIDMFKREMKRFGATDDDITKLTEGMRDAKKFDSNRTKRSMKINWDAETNGKKVADLMENDMDKLFESYVRDSAGYAALNKVGIKSPSHADWLVDQSIRKAIFEDSTLNVDVLSREGKEVKEAIQLIMGRTIETGSEEVVKNARRLRSLTHSTMLTQVGFASIGEVSRALTFAGLRTVMGSVRGLGAFRWNGKLVRGADLKHMAADMREIEEVLGFIGEDTWMHSVATRGEDAKLSDGGWGRILDNGLAGVSHINHFTSLFQNLQGGLEKISTRAVATKMKGIFKGGTYPKNKGMAMAFKEVGLDEGTFSKISDWMKANPKSAEFNGRTVDLFNLEAMPLEMRNQLTMAMQRLSYRMMQRNFVGEQSMFMNKTVGKILTQFKSFSIVSLEKQLVHDVKADKIMASQTLMWSTMLSYMAYQAQANAKATMISDEDKREEYLDRINDPRNIAFGMFNKSNQLASLGIAGDMMATLGMLPDDLLYTPGKGSGFNGGGVDSMIPVFGTLNNLIGVPKSIKGAVFDEDKGAADVIDQAQKSLPLGNAIGIGHALGAAADAIR